MLSYLFSLPPLDRGLIKKRVAAFNFGVDNAGVGSPPLRKILSVCLTIRKKYDIIYFKCKIIKSVGR